jgi:hypothetical protein
MRNKVPGSHKSDRLLSLGEALRAISGSAFFVRFGIDHLLFGNMPFTIDLVYYEWSCAHLVHLLHQRCALLLIDAVNILRSGNLTRYFIIIDFHIKSVQVLPATRSFEKTISG